MEQININKEGELWIVRFKFSHETKDFVKSLGFWFDGTKKVWYTSDPMVAAKLDPNAAGNAVKQIEASKATDSELDIPVPKGLDYLPHQKAGIAYAVQRKNTLIGDEMGLGKTIQAIGVINADPTIKSVLIVCPATIKLIWKNELEKWLVRKLSVGIVNGSIPDTDVVIVNYDILGKWHDELVARNFDLMIIDECHKVKNPKAKRTQFLLGNKKDIKPITATRRIFMSGTPIVNRPVELWPILQSIDPQGMGKNFMGYAKRYCAGHQGRYGWDFKGASNLGELQMKLRSSIMVRRLKQDVLTELPAKRRQIVKLTPTGAAIKIVAAEKEAFDKLKIEELEALVAKAEAEKDKAAYASAVSQLKAAQKIAFEDMSRVRHQVAVAKIPYVIDFLRDLLEDSDDKVVLMLHHHDVAHAIADAFPGAAIVTGEVAVNKRQAEVDRFQNDPNCQLFIGSIHDAGVGITLTASSQVVFCELYWVPGNISQAEDRCHRIGQHDSVLVQHLVFDGSVDSRMAAIIVGKQEVIDKALDKDMVVPTVEVVSGPVAKPTTNNNPGFKPEQVEAIHTALKMLAGMCDGAYALDGAGFNKFDTQFGHSLAESTRLSSKQIEHGKRLAIKYGRQLPADLLAIIKQV
jgi:SWI/SNF-related matrix-associated actin-dependent regulator 1 of chromatin subfamily A